MTHSSDHHRPAPKRTVWPGSGLAQHTLVEHALCPLDFNQSLKRGAAHNRRLFLLLQKIFWRHEQTPAFELRQLGVNTLGFSDTLATKEIKQKLVRCAKLLLKHNILSLPPEATTVRDLFEKRGKRQHYVRFHRGTFFDEPTARPIAACESPLVEPLQSIGLDAHAIRRILRDYKPGMIQQWADITLAAVERKIVTKSPQAYFMHHIKEAQAKRTTPPDWWRDLQRKEFTIRQQESAPAEQGSEDSAFDDYLSNEGREAFERVMETLFKGLQASGQAEDEARRNATDMARINLRSRFHHERSATDSQSIGDTLKHRHDPK